MNNPASIGSDAYLVNPERLIYYDDQVTKALLSPNLMIWRQILGIQMASSWAQHSIEWNYEIGPFGARHDIWGLEPEKMSILYSPKTNKFKATSAKLKLNPVEIEQARLGGNDIEGDSIRAIANQLSWEEDYYILNGWNQNSVNYTKGILEFTGVQDAGAPTGAWDDPTDVYADIITICGKLDAIGYDGPINLVMDTQLKGNFRKFIDDGTTTFERAVHEWIGGELNGGKIFWNDSAFVDPATQNTGIAYNGTVAAGAVHKCLAFGNHPANKIVLGHDVTPRNHPVADGYVDRDYTTRYTVKVGSPLHIVFMDEIDEST